MSSTITAQLKATFDLASLRHEAKYLRKTTDWEKSRNIRERFELERTDQDKQYFDSYESRVESVTKTLIDRGAAVTREHKHPWFGHDAFDRSLITKQAHRLVQQDHQRRHMKLDEREATELDELIAQVKQRDAQLEKPLQDFNQAANQVTRRQEFNRYGLNDAPAASTPDAALATGPTPPERHR